MKDTTYYQQKYENTMDAIYRALQEADVQNSDYVCTLVFDETANAEEIVGYYLSDGLTTALKRWQENTEHIEMTEQDREVTRILTELDRMYN